MNIEPVKLSAQDDALYGKLHVSKGDIAIARSCAQYIQKKGWHTFAYQRRGSISIQQISFTTTLIVAYARPFARSRGNIDFPKRLLSYDASEKELHDRLLRLRNQEYAHTDAVTYEVTPYKGGSIICVENIRDVRFTPQEIDLFLRMTEGLLARIGDRLGELRLKG